MEFYSFVYFLDSMEREKPNSFEDGMVVVQRLKYSFVYNRSKNILLSIIYGVGIGCSYVKRCIPS